IRPGLLRSWDEAGPCGTCRTCFPGLSAVLRTSSRRGLKAGHTAFAAPDNVAHGASAKAFHRVVHRGSAIALEIRPVTGLAGTLVNRATEPQRQRGTTRKSESAASSPARLNAARDRAARIRSDRFPRLHHLQNRWKILRFHEDDPVGGVRPCVPKKRAAVHACDRHRIWQSRRIEKTLVPARGETLLP